MHLIPLSIVGTVKNEARCLFLCVLIFLGLAGHAQKVAPLSLGATLPNVEIQNIVNYNSPSVRLSDFEDQLLLLDFWATWCTSCLHGFPKLDSLQKAYKGQLQVLLVNTANTGDDARKVKAFFERRRKKNGERYNLPTVVGDTVLARLFPHKLIPHYVWIRKGRVEAITGAEAVTAANLTAALAGGELALPLKKDVMDFDPDKGLLSDGNGGDPSHLLFRSTLIRHLEGLPVGGGKRLSRDSARRTFYFLNQPVLQLYLAAVGDSFSNRTILEVRDTTRFRRGSAASACWAASHTYCYEITVPATTSGAEAGRLMLQDLNRYLGLDGRIETRPVDCWVLRLGAGVTLRTKGGKRRLRVATPGSPHTLLSNLPLSRLVGLLNSLGTEGAPAPIIRDETGYTGPVDLELTSPLHDLPGLQKELQRYGLILEKTTRMLEVLVLSEKKTS